MTRSELEAGEYVYNRSRSVWRSGAANTRLATSMLTCKHRPPSVTKLHEFHVKMCLLNILR